MTRAPLLLLVLALAGCVGRAEPVEIVRPWPDVLAVTTPFDGPTLQTVCPHAQAAVASACLPAETAFVAPGGRTFVVDAGRPDASDANDGSAAHPWRTISRATGTGVLRPGDAVLVRAGVYRETVAPRAGGTGPEARVTYAAYPGESVVVSGADPADDGWAPLGDGRWRRPWSGPDLP
ncbi:MAG TPA: hypothetical protein VF576_02520, partial [Rubricoccaceae bacterium]